MKKYILPAFMLLIMNACTVDPEYEHYHFREYDAVTDKMKIAHIVENFDDNKNGWPLYESELQNAVIDNGHLVVQNDYTSNWDRWLVIPDIEGEHEIEYSFRVVQSSSDEPVWAFCGTERIGFDSERLGITYSFTTLPETVEVNPIGEYNKLTVRNIDGTCLIFVNEKVARMTNDMPRTARVGLTVPANTHVELDYVHVYSLDID